MSKIIRQFDHENSDGDSQRAVLLGIQKGLKLCYEDHQFPRVTVEINCLGAINMIRGKKKVQFKYRKIVETILLTMKQRWEVKVEYVYKEANRLASRLATEAFDCAKVGCNEVKQLSPEARRLLKEDMKKMPQRKEEVQIGERCESCCFWALCFQLLPQMRTNVTKLTAASVKLPN
ncbi:OLC1v1023183C1 [Oldenlandia corymbosa var. corymbosa]|uniref:OLC1v1023183C1 n=1 Tax=Oldenlandia corymbosa var. corymbosa TaxID=529605 RepID=A0AAV1C086_OLDCO|nr:OLC1v1023183C1 [Oldenlandia corymbosa var. corymbosa]